LVVSVYLITIVDYHIADSTPGNSC